jgi:hypothetical protein
MDIYLNAKALGEPSTEYVAWIDLMGTKAIMKRSVATIISSPDLFLLLPPLWLE